MPRIGAAASDAGRAAQHGLHPPQRAHKKRRTVQLGSSPPPFITALQHSKTSERACRHEATCHITRMATCAYSAPASPGTARQIKLTAGRRQNALELRSSSPASFDSSNPAAIAPRLAGLHHNSHKFGDIPMQSRHEQLRHKHNTGPNDTSSPIGTFGGQINGHSDRGVSRTRVRSANVSSPTDSRTAGLQARRQVVVTRSRSSANPRLADLAINENATPHSSGAAAEQKGRDTKGAAQKSATKPKRQHRSKMLRVQLGVPPYPTTGDRPFSDAIHQLNSQPDEHADDAADESEISYFPTLQPPRLPATVLNGIGPSPSDPDVADIPLVGSHRPLSVAPEHLPLTSNTNRDEIIKVTSPSEGELGSQGDVDVGLFEVLSQSAMRKFDQLHTTESAALQQPTDTLRVPFDRTSSPAFDAWHQVHIEFDDSHYTHTQAQLTAKVIVTRNAERWTAVYPEFSLDRVVTHARVSSAVTTMVQARSTPPTSRSVSRQLGLTPAQLLKTPLSELEDFAHNTCGDVEGSSGAEGEDLVPFDDKVSYAGYRLMVPSAGAFAQLRPFNAEALRKRMQTRRKEVVKIIIPFSEPSVSSRATRARFVTPNPAADASPSSLDTPGVVLIWMQSTARRFLQGLEAMLQAGSADLEEDHSYRLDVEEDGLYPCPILQYDAHAGSPNKASYVALYVHLDRAAEARSKLAALELGENGEESYRPFTDPRVRLIVTSLRGETLCLV